MDNKNTEVEIKIPKTLLIVPCYNEAERLPVDLYKKFAVTNPHVSFLLVNDGSRDKTLEIIEAMRDENPAVFDVHNLAQNSGKAEAVRQGFQEGLKRSPDFIGYWDSDLATPLEVIPMFEVIFEERPEIEAIMGARVQLLGRKIMRSPARHYMGRLAATLISTVLKIRVYDTQCGAKMFRVTPTLADVFARPFLSKWLFDVEVLVRLVNSRAEVGGTAILYEFPLPAWRDVGGSKVKPFDFVKALYDLSRIIKQYRLDKK